MRFINPKNFRNAICFLLIGLSYNAAANDSPSAPPEMTLNNHMLAGKIWAVSDNRFVEKEHVIKELLESNYVLLGETHDNPLHHAYQADMLNALNQSNRKASIVLEMLTDKQADSLISNSPQDAGQFFDTVKWEQSGWPPRETYKPLVEMIIDTEYRYFAGNFERKTLRELIKTNGASAPEEMTDLVAAVIFDEGTIQDMRSDILASHCGMIPPKMIDGMLLGQRLRDAIMARTLVKKRSGGTGVLIAGSGHTRTDRGTPAYITQLEPGAKIFSLAWVEVEQGFEDPEAYAEAWHAESLPFDYVWFTARVKRSDPCEEMKQYMKNHKT